MWHWRGECSLCASSAFRQRAAAVLLQTSRFSLFLFFLARGGGDLSRSQLRATFFPRCSDLFFKEKKKSRARWLFGEPSPSSRCFPLGPAFPQPGRELLLFLFSPQFAPFRGRPGNGRAPPAFAMPAPRPGLGAAAPAGEDPPGLLLRLFVFGRAPRLVSL